VLFKVVFHRVLTTRTPIGRKVRPKALLGHTPLIRTKSRHLAAAGVERVPRVAAVRDGKPALDDGRVLDVTNVVWCTGFEPGFSWIDLPVFDEHGLPVHEDGVTVGEPGLYFVGLHFLHAMSSGMVHGVSRDAARIADVIAERSLVPRAEERSSVVAVPA
jgi:putative flavoprotein involved in K+ transport